MSITNRQISAFAKINLTLRVLGRRADGFHEIDTLISRITLADTLEYDPAAGPQDRLELICDDPTIPSGPENLIHKAAEAFRLATGIACAGRLVLHKRIPHGAGLGGGSSDAAAVLHLLRDLHRPDLDAAALARMAAPIGSDVPFFCGDTSARCLGRGEETRSAPLSGPSLPLLLLKPSYGIPTPWAYKSWLPSQQIPLPPEQEASLAPQSLGPQNPGLELVNDLERSVFAKHLHLAALKGWLRSQPGVRAALMSGSGSTVFAVTADEATAHALATRAGEEFDPDLQAFVCTTKEN